MNRDVKACWQDYLRHSAADFEGTAAFLQRSVTRRRGLFRRGEGITATSIVVASYSPFLAGYMAALDHFISGPSGLLTMAGRKRLEQLKDDATNAAEAAIENASRSFDRWEDIEALLNHWNDRGDMAFDEARDAGNRNGRPTP